MWQLYAIVGELLTVTVFTLTKYLLSVRTVEVDYLIVGAGASGIAAASMLMQNGVHSIVILEAENRIGGRINTVPFGDGVVELGCQWVHGEVGNVVFKMASEHDLLMESVVGSDFEKMFFVDSSGNVVDREESAQLFFLLDEIFEYSERDLINYTGSVGEYMNHEYFKKLEMLSLSNSSLTTAFLDWFHKARNIMDSADSWFEVSGRFEAGYKECEGKQNWAWKSGYSTVLDLLMRKIPDPANELSVRNKTVFEKEVKKIKWDIVDGQNKNKVVVECSDGSVYAAQHVIVTVSLGVLKERADLMFEPALPEEKLNTIKGLSFGTVDKILLKFPYKWWPDGFTAYSVLKTNETAQCTVEKCWVQDVFVFQDVDNQPLVLSAWLSGSAARHMEQLSEEEIKQEIFHFISRLMGTALNVTVPSPALILRSSWSSNPHFRGSYSFRSMETERMGVSAAQLSEPVANSNGISVLHFAGEATHSSFYSTVHGAVETGWREATRLIKLNK